MINESDTSKRQDISKFRLVKISYREGDYDMMMEKKYIHWGEKIYTHTWWSLEMTCIRYTFDVIGNENVQSLSNVNFLKLDSLHR